MESSVRFVSARTGRDADAFDRTTILASSAPLGWRDVLVETGRNESWTADAIATTQHYLALNLDARPLAFDVVEGRRATRVVMDPGTVWVCPARDAFTHRVDMPSTFALAVIDPARVERAVGARTALSRVYAVRDAAIEHVVRAMISEIESGGENGPTFVDALTTALAVRLARVAGRDVPDARGALSHRRLRTVLELIEARLETGATLEEMAGAVGLTPHHFARAFRRATGTSPHRFLLARRLEHARSAIELGHEPLGAISMRLGFADQSHFTRHFRRRYGVTPGALARR